MTRSQFIKRARQAVRAVKSAQEWQRTFAEDLDAYLGDREAKHLSDEAYVSEQYLSDVRHQRRKISPAVLERIAELETK